MTIFVIWKKQEDELFRKRYFEITGETIERKPLESADSYMVGSSRLRDHHIEKLTSEFELSFDETEFVAIEGN